MDYGSVVRNIAKEVVEKCAKANFFISEDFCAYFVKLLKLDPNYGVMDDLSYRQSDFKNFVNYVAWQLQTEDPKLKIIKMQFLFETVTDRLQKFADDRRKILAEQLEPLRCAILQDLSDKTDLNKRTEQIIQYLTLASGLGNPKRPKVHKEVQTAMISVMNRDELVELLQSEVDVRSEKLDILLRTVAGIRLYNYSCRKGGEGIDNLPELLKRSVRLLRKRISAPISFNRAQREYSKLSALLDACYVAKNTKNNVVLDARLPSYATEENLEYAKLILVLYIQFFKSTHKLLDEVDESEDRLLSAEESYDRLLSYLNNRTSHNLSLNAFMYFPIFEKLYEWWKCMQDEAVTLTALRIAFDEQFVLMRTTQFHNILIKSFPNENIGRRVSLGEKCISHAEMLRTLGFKKGVKMYRRESFKDFDEITSKLELVSTNGVLSRGDSDHGIVEYQHRFYTFCCSVGLICFGRDPEYYILRVIYLARKKYELIGILSIRDQMKLYRHKKKIIEPEPVEDTRIESMNTDFFDTVGHYDENYEWNVWEMRKKALQMAKLKRCKTTSTQTIKTNCRNIIGVQTHPSREQSVQTMPNNSTNTPKPLRYLVGLKGKRNCRPYCVDFETHWDDFDFYKNKTLK